MSSRCLMAAATCLVLASTGAFAQSRVEQQIQNNNQSLNRMMQEQGQSRQQQIDNSSLRNQIDRDRNRPPNYPDTGRR